MGESQHMINRRTVTKGIAWSVPAIAVASAAPAFAGSGSKPTIRFISSCKLPGNSCKPNAKFGYRFLVEICNPNPDAIWIHTFTYTPVGTNLTLTQKLPTLPFKVDGDKCITVLLEATGSNSGNQSFTLNTSSRWGHTEDPKDDPDQSEHDQNPMTGSTSIPATPPDCPCEYAAPAPGATAIAGATPALAKDAPSSESTLEGGASTEQSSSDEPTGELTADEPVTNVTVEEPKTEATPVAPSAEAESTEATE